MEGGKGGGEWLVIATAIMNSLFLALTELHRHLCFSDIALNAFTLEAFLDGCLLFLFAYSMS